MVIEEEKARIRAEEIFRLEVRRELEKSKSRPSRRAQVWLFLNSSLGVWVLSSIFLASLTTAYTAYQHWHAEQLRNAEIAWRLDTEISNRIVNAQIGGRVMNGNLKKGMLYAPQWVHNETVSYLDNFFRTDPSNPRDFSIFPEYRDRTFSSLIFELIKVVHPSAQPELKEALKAYNKLSELASDYSKETSTRNKDKSLKAVENSMEILNHEVMKPRWQPISER